MKLVTARNILLISMFSSTLSFAGAPKNFKEFFTQTSDTTYKFKEYREVPVEGIQIAPVFHYSKFLKSLKLQNIHPNITFFSRVKTKSGERLYLGGNLITKKGYKVCVDKYKLMSKVNAVFTSNKSDKI